MMGEERIDELKLGNLKLDSLRKSFEQVDSKVSSILLLTLKWRDLEEHYDKVERDLEERARLLPEAEITRKVVEERKDEMALKEEELCSLEAQIQECSGQLDAKRKEVALEKGRLHSCSQLLKCRKLELESVMKSICDSSTQLTLTKEQLASIQKSIEERSEEVRLKEQHSATIKKYLEEISARIESKKKELSLVEKVNDERLKELELKENENVSLRRSLEERLGEVEIKERQLADHAKELDLKQQERDAFRQAVEEQKKELEVNKSCYDLQKVSLEDRLREVEIKERQLEGRAKELDLKQEQMGAVHQAVEEQKKELEEKKKLHDLQKGSLEERFRELDLKEEQLQNRSKELELKAKRINAAGRAVEERRKQLELKEKQLTETVRFHHSLPTSATDSQSESTQHLAIMDGISLQFLLNDHLTKHDLVHQQVSSAIKTSKYPAMLVLDAMQGFYPPFLRKGGIEFEANITRKSCILLLDQLLVHSSSEIGPHVQQKAINLAHEWKTKMTFGAEDQLEILGFLHLLAAFRIAFTFNVDDFGALLDRVADQKQASKLRRHLRITETATGTFCAVSSIPCNIRTEQLDHLAVSNADGSCSSDPADCSVSRDEHSRLVVKKRPRTDGSLIVTSSPQSTSSVEPSINPPTSQAGISSGRVPSRFGLSTNQSGPAPNVGK